MRSGSWVAISGAKAAAVYSTARVAAPAIASRFRRNRRQKARRPERDIRLLAPGRVASTSAFVRDGEVTACGLSIVRSAIVCLAPAKGPGPLRGRADISVRPYDDRS